MKENIFQSLLSIERSFCQVKIDNKADCFLQLSKSLANNDMQSELILDALLERERLGSTSIGHGLALPHARLAKLPFSSIALMTLKKPIDYGSFDDAPVNIICALLVHEEAIDEHLKTLASLMELFQQPTFCKALKKASSPEMLYDVACNWDNDE